MRKFLVSTVLLAALAPASAASPEVPETIAAPGEVLVMTLHAQGAQIYECKADTSGKLGWRFREPVAALLDQSGRSVGRHYAGPNWELNDGSAIVGRIAGRAAGATANDITLLKLDVTSRRGTGGLATVTTIQRLNTRGGAAEGPCGTEGAFLSVPYAADYAFHERPR
ncbi:DUF3455 domain-containing protein [Bradyrhizobium sediminis]|uniref:DUF3455 domain-containing protein n=1 Tax=Bradyrhizobium sediminis TaxID=2840469 RepID=A0A975RSM9_9BRAD|nr:DUF3455 domain-containing protein [Bradyrhizobium sediminis]QWG18103.1 DUF3455 domain-containing protein [Bradyrhizobium sediminis]